jgi:hypothetical protein
MQGASCQLKLDSSSTIRTCTREERAKHTTAKHVTRARCKEDIALHVTAWHGAAASIIRVMQRDAGQQTSRT